MGTTADKLAKLAETKADLKAALAEKGQTVGDVFSEYPAAVRAIESGTSSIYELNIEYKPGIMGDIYILAMDENGNYLEFRANEDKTYTYKVQGIVYTNSYQSEIYEYTDGTLIHSLSSIKIFSNEGKSVVNIKGRSTF